MSMYDKAFLSDEAKKLHVIRDTLEKVYRLQDISTHDLRTMLLPVCRDLDAFQLEDAKKTVGDFLLHYLSVTYSHRLH